MSSLTTPLATPSRATASSSTATRAPLTAPSPHYQTKDRKHSLYGTEDRVVLDPGSSVWKVGFSGEAKPRAVFWSGETDGERPIWEEEFESVVSREIEGWELAEEDGGEGGNWRREMGEEVVERRLGDRLREVFSK